MTLRVVGAGLGRTGTLSLKVALERLLGAPCYHMAEVFGHPEHIPAWHAAARGTLPDWAELLAGYRAVVDWPSVAFWPELSQAFPDALVGDYVQEFMEAHICGKMDLLLSGHDHNRQWLEPTCGTEFVVSGAANQINLMIYQQFVFYNEN